MSTATPEASQVDSVAVPRLALDHLQTALPAGPTARTPHDSPPEQQRRRPDDDDPLVEFNVGGAHYVTSLSTLAAISGSAFASVVEDQQARRGRLQGDEEGEDAIATFDRDGASFRWVLIYLRWVSTGSAPPLALPQDAGERQQLAEEAAFYGLPELEKCCRRPRISQFELMQVRHMQGRYLACMLVRCLLGSALVALLSVVCTTGISYICTAVPTCKIVLTSWSARECAVASLATFGCRPAH